MLEERSDKQAMWDGSSLPFGEGRGGAELVSDEVHEIMSYRPHWIIRRGNAIFFLVLAFLLSLTFVISYPDIVTGSARLVAVHAPKLVIAKGEGKLEKLLVQNEQQVKSGQPLAYLQSTAKHEQVLQLQQWIDTTIAAAQKADLNTLVSMPLPDLAQLGELQPDYQAFQNVVMETMQVLANGYYRKKRAALQKDLAYLSALKTNTQGQMGLIEQDRQLQEKEYKAYESLARDKVIAPLELNQYKSRLLAKEQSINQVQSQITASAFSSHAKQKELLDLQKFVLDQQQKFHSSLLDLKSKTAEWLQKYIVAAPESGTVLFTTSLQENQLLASGQELFYIQPAQTLFYSELMTAQKGLGKIRQGQKVLIKVDSYPSAEFGYLRGTVDYISAIPARQDSFLIKVQLQNGLKTNYNKIFFFRNNLSGTAEIITDDRKLIDRLLSQLRQVFER